MSKKKNVSDPLRDENIVKAVKKMNTVFNRRKLTTHERYAVLQIYSYALAKSKSPNWIQRRLIKFYLKFVSSIKLEKVLASK